MVYGQTGSGKSYTMEGYEYVMAEKRAAKQYGYAGPTAGKDMRALIGHISEENEGVSARSIRQLFNKAN